MAIVAGYDVHRNQITFDALDTDSGEVTRGRIDSTREAVSAWVERFPGRQVQVAVEACTGWLFVCEALAEAGAVPHLAEPAEVAARRGSKRRAKTATCASCSPRGGCRRRGSHPRTSSSGVPAPGCARRSSTSAASGCSGSRRRCSTTASPPAACPSGC